MGTPLAIGIDLGGTRLRAALVNAGGKVLARAACDTDVNGGPDAVIGQMLRLVSEIKAGAADAAVAAAGVSAPGPLDSDTGTILGIPTLPGWTGVPLRALLSERLGLPVVLENDGIAAANGEWKFGAGRGLSHLVYVTVSTGIGGGVVAGSRLLRGRRGMAGHVGHMIVEADGPACPCGARGCFEAVASGSALARDACKAAEGNPRSALAALPRAQVNGAAVVEAARAGDPVSLSLLDALARRLGIGFASLIHLYSPEKLIMGGGVSQAFDLIGPRIRQTVESLVMPPFRDVAIEPAALGDNAGLVGAAGLALAPDFFRA